MIGLIVFLLPDNSVVPVFKPVHWSSFDIIRRIKSLSNIKKIGHAGTLDPLAEGILLIATGSATKTIEQLQEQHKHYLATICLGATTPTLDREYAPEQIITTDGITKMELEKVIESSFCGAIEQLPPIFSAVKINGKRAYRLARQGKIPDVKSRIVTIFSIQLLEVSTCYSSRLPNYNLTTPDVLVTNIKLQIRCSKGTYIRSIARDLGIFFGVPAYLTALTRTQVGDYRLEDCIHLTSKQREGLTV